MVAKGDEEKVNEKQHDSQTNLRNLHDTCKKHMFYHVTLTMTDGNKFDGIIESVDTDNFTVLIGEDVMEREGENNPDIRYAGYGRPGRRYRRFRRQIFPLATLAALALLPYVAPTPYPYDPYYPYPYPYPYY